MGNGVVSVTTGRNGVTIMLLLSVVSYICQHIVRNDSGMVATFVYILFIILSCILDAAVIRKLLFDSMSRSPIVLDDVHCTGTEDKLLDCSHASIGNHLCDQFFDMNEPLKVAIQCQGTIHIFTWENNSMLL